MGQLAPDLEEGGKLDRGGLAHGAPEQGAFDGRIEAVPPVHDVGNHLPCPGAAKRFLARLGIEQVQHVGAHLDVEQDLGRDSVRRPPRPASPGHRP